MIRPDLRSGGEGNVLNEASSQSVQQSGVTKRLIGLNVFCVVKKDSYWDIPGGVSRN